MPDIVMFTASLAMAQDAQPATPANPGMVGLPEGSQPVAAPPGAPAPGGTQQPAGPAPGGTPASPFGSQFFILMIAVLGFMILMQVFTGRKEKKRRQEMLSSMKRGDRVQTMGGIIGTIHEIYEDGEMVLRLEEGRVRVARSAVQGVLKESRSRPEDQPEVVVKPGREKASV